MKCKICGESGEKRKYLFNKVYINATDQKDMESYNSMMNRGFCSPRCEDLSEKWVAAQPPITLQCHACKNMYETSLVERAKDYQDLAFCSLKCAVCAYPISL